MNIIFAIQYGYEVIFDQNLSNVMNLMESVLPYETVGVSGGVLLHMKTPNNTKIEVLLRNDDHDNYLDLSFTTNGNYDTPVETDLHAIRGAIDTTVQFLTDTDQNKLNIKYTPLNDVRSLNKYATHCIDLINTLLIDINKSTSQSQYKKIYRAINMHINNIDDFYENFHSLYDTFSNIYNYIESIGHIDILNHIEETYINIKNYIIINSRDSIIRHIILKTYNATTTHIENAMDDQPNSYTVYLNLIKKANKSH